MTGRSAEEPIAELEAEIVELTARLPRHSVPPAMLLHLEELEDRLAELMSRPDETSPGSRGGLPSSPYSRQSCGQRSVNE